MTMDCSREPRFGLAASLAAAALAFGCGATPRGPLPDGRDGGEDSSATSDAPITPPLDTSGPAIDTGGPAIDTGGPAVDTGSTPFCPRALCVVGTRCCESLQRCLPPGERCPDDPPPPLDSGTLLDAGSGACRTNIDCPGSRYCAGTGCGTAGTCTARPEGCTLEYNPVCGCDGRTYGNPCAAGSAGVRVASRGECGAVDAGAVDTGALDAGAADTGAADVGVTQRCNSTRDCGSGQECVFQGEACVRDGFCTAAIACFRPETFCSCAGETYLSCRPDRPTSARGACAATSCRSNSDCAEDAYCAGDVCGTIGACATRPTACIEVYSPVCGCDGRTYSNDCYAASAGARILARGVCPRDL